MKSGYSPHPGHKQKIAIDFDGTIYPFLGGYNPETYDPADLPDAPIEGSREALERLSRDYEVVIFSSRARKWRGWCAIQAWLHKYGIPFDEVTAVKIPAAIYVDDRAIRFNGDWSDVLVGIFELEQWQERKVNNGS